MMGWRTLVDAAPNAAHHAHAGLERLGYLTLLVTQNVDRLHQRAGHRRVVDLHGRIDQVGCLACGTELDRAACNGVLMPDVVLRWTGAQVAGRATLAMALPSSWRNCMSVRGGNNTQFDNRPTLHRQLRVSCRATVSIYSG
ncbi:MAG: Sir2 family NAD-dependent protein deacetylase [Acidobacteriota bacterium]|nr:Sir2 family NAD-dependent protein deacetylase [Acidobacteriota bacterium]